MISRPNTNFSQGLIRKSITIDWIYNETQADIFLKMNIIKVCCIATVILEFKLVRVYLLPTYTSKSMLLIFE